MNFDQPNLENKKTPENNIKKGVYYIFLKNPQLEKIGTKEQYSRYLDSIFPESKVKEIGYHNGEMKEFPENTGMSFFTDSLKAANKFWNNKVGGKEIIEKEKVTAMAIFNIKNPKMFKSFFGTSYYDLNSFCGSENNIIKLIHEKSSEKIEGEPDPFYYRKMFGNSLAKEGYDSIVIGPDDWMSTEDFPYSKQFVLFNASQIHLLGTEEDLKQFKKFIERNKKK